MMRSKVKWTNSLILQMFIASERKKEIAILNGKYQVKFLIGREAVYIVDFKSARQNSY